MAIQWSDQIPQHSSTKRRLAGREWGRLIAMFGFILAINLLGWGIYLFYLMRRSLRLPGERRCSRKRCRCWGWRSRH